MNSVNKLVNYEKYNLPMIADICDLKCNYEHDHHKKYNISSIEIFPIISSWQRNIQKNCDFKKEFNIIGNKMKRLIDIYKYKPNDFMFIFPTISNNQFAKLLHTFLEKFWKKQYENDSNSEELENENPFVILHKSVDKGPIDLTKSID